MCSCPRGVGCCTSLQQLLPGFTSGALRIVSNQEDHLVQDVSYRVESCFEKERICNYPNGGLQESYVESEEDVEHQESSDAANSGN